MKTLFATAIALLSAILVCGQPTRNFGTEARQFMKTLQENHFEPKKIDDGYSVWVFETMIEEIDAERIYFTEADIKTLLAYRNKIDDELNGTSWNFIPALTQLFKKNLERYQTDLNAIASQPIDLTKDEKFSNDTLWCADAVSLKKKLNLLFRYNILERLADLRVKHPDGAEKDFLLQYESQARQQVKKVMLREADRILHHTTGFESYLASEFFKSMASGFDPHTTYYSLLEVKNVMSSLSTKGYYFGITLEENDRGEVAIGQLMPGGPAWKSGEINTGDVLLVLRWEGQDPIDLWGVDIDDVNNMLTESNHASLELTLRKSDGASKVVFLRKEKVESEEAIVKSFILEGPRRIGYISLPDFYTDWGEEDGAQCANDVAREIIKLKKENIEGLILDLRFNGGGAMMEAVAMAGIFIDAGPVGVIKDRMGEMTSLKDMNRGTVYDGPLAIMVNALSASASELLAAALQDYNRAIIIGGNTFGKATVQRMIPTDPKAVAQQAKAYYTKGSLPSGFSFAKITVERLYRITGKTAQLNGVAADISIPDVFESMPFRERYLPNAFKADSIIKKTYYKPFEALPIRDLREKSKVRIDKQPKFEAIRKYSEKMAFIKEGSEPVSLKWDKFKKSYAEETSTLKNTQSGNEPVDLVYKASKLKSEEQRMQMDGYVDEFNKAWIKKLQEDVSLNEAFLIICDLIPLVTKK